MKRIFRIFIISFVMFSGTYNLKADEGMWLLSMIDQLNYNDMQKMGLHLTAEQIYSINNSSLKDAVVHFGGGCTAEMISSEGLLITNHHCGYGAIQSLSTVENDYLSNGYWALKQQDELKCDGLTAKFFVRMEDVTRKVLNQLQDTMSETNRNNKIQEIIKQLQKEAMAGNHYDAQVKSFYNGNEFYMFVYEVYKDLRLVGTPPNSIGKFGGDTDNWMWPRHTCDFSMFRIYTAPDGSPAEYSQNNVPMKPRKFLTVSLKGINNGDFTMVIGYPGTTDRFLTSYGVKSAIEKFNPSIVKIREKKLEIMKQDMNASDAVRIKYSAKYAGISNYWKYFIGQTKGLKRLKVFDKKAEEEKEFAEWINRDSKRQAEYYNTMKNIANAYSELDKYIEAKVYFSEALLRGAEIIPFSKNFTELADLLKADKKDTEKINKTIATLKETATKFYKDYDLATDKKLFTAMFDIYIKNIKPEHYPKEIAEINKKYKDRIQDYTDKVYSKSIFSSIEKVNILLNKPDYKSIEKDIAFQLMKGFTNYSNELTKKLTVSYETLDKANRQYVKGIREMHPDKKYYPNANSTMRLTYGKVLDYYPADAVHFDFKTTLKGVIEKKDPLNDDFILPDKIESLYNAKDYGIYGDNGKLTTCFITNNDITGGNSGSPVINADGELIGLAFDGNWEAMSGNIAFEPDLQRCICVDIRYVLFIIDKFAGAKNLIREMNLISKTGEVKLPIMKKELQGIDDPSGFKPDKTIRKTNGARVNESNKLTPASPVK